MVALLLMVLPLSAQTDPRTLPKITGVTALPAIALPLTDGAGGRMDYGGVLGTASDGLYVGCFQNTKLARVSLSGVVLAKCSGPTLAPSMDTLGGVLDAAGRVVVTGYSSYDAVGAMTVSHAAGASLTTLGGWQSLAGIRAGQVAGYLAPIPPEWQALLKGAAITGQGAISIVTRTNFGPGVYAFDPANLGPQTPLVSYPSEHRTWGDYGVATTDGYSGSESFGGCFIPRGSSSLACVWTQATNPVYCYGNGSTNPADHGTLVGGEMTCYDPSNPYKGPHGYPYKTYLELYDLGQLADVAAGTRNPWDVKPASRLLLPDSTDAMRVNPGGTTYDPATGVMSTTVYEDRATPRIRRYQVTLGAAVPPPTAVDCAGTWGAWTRIPNSESACSAGGSRTFIESRLFTVSTSPANGGAACPASPESRTSTEACTPPIQTVTLTCWVTSVGTSYADGDARRTIRCDTNGPVTNLANGVTFTVTVPK